MPRIAGVPVQVGLYAVPLALLAYAVLGSSPQLIVGPASTVAIVSGSLVADIADGDPKEAVAVTAALAIAAGFALLMVGLLRLGWVAEFLSKPIVTGFVFGLTLTIVVGEVPTLLGIPKPPGDLIGVFVRTIERLDQIDVRTAIIGGLALVVLVGGGRLAPQVPWGLATLVLGVVVSRLLDLGAKGVATVGEVPAGLPPFGLPMVPRADLGAVVVGGVSLALVALAEGLAATRLFATRGGYRVETERELVGMGAANIAAGLSGGLGVAGSLSKTAAAAQAGSRSQVTGLTSAGLVVVVLVTFTWFFTDLPRAVLAAIVVAAVWGLMDVHGVAPIPPDPAGRLRRRRRRHDGRRAVRTARRPGHRDRGFAADHHLPIELPAHRGAREDQRREGGVGPAARLSRSAARGRRRRCASRRTVVLGERDRHRGAAPRRGRALALHARPRPRPRGHDAARHHERRCAGAPGRSSCASTASSSTSPGCCTRRTPCSMRSGFFELLGGEHCWHSISQCVQRGAQAHRAEGPRAASAAKARANATMARPTWVRSVSPWASTGWRRSSSSRATSVEVEGLDDGPADNGAPDPST